MNLFVDFRALNIVMGWEAHNVHFLLSPHSKKCTLWASQPNLCCAKLEVL